MKHLPALAGSFTLLALPSLSAAAPVISEFLAVNGTVLADRNGRFSDWIEIHNPDANPLPLSGYHLTDNAADLTAWTFPAGTSLAAGGYLLVFASGSPVAPPGELHANFKLSSSGEFLALVAPDGQTVVDSFSPAFPVQYPDVSYGVPAGGGSARYFLTPTPGTANGAGVLDPASQIAFSPAGGTFAGSVSVSLTTSAAGSGLYYTTDGTDPTAVSLHYTAPFTLTSTARIRARIINSGEAAGAVFAASYIRLGADVQNFSSPLPVVVVENFGAGDIPDKRAANGPASDGSGITQVDRQPARLLLMERPAGGVARLSDAPAISSRIGIRVRGSSSAAQPARKENYSLETWGAADHATVDIAPFGMPPDNDWVLYAPYNYDRTLIRNSFVYELMRRMGHYAARTQFVEVFINTEGDDLTMADFAGVFVFMEKIKPGKNRVNIDSLSADGLTGGWLIESNRMDAMPADGSGTPPFNFHTAGPNRIKQGPYGGSAGADQGGDDIPTGYNTFFNYVSPSGYDTTAAQRNAITAWFDNFENTLYSEDFRRPDTGYRAWLDTGSFIDHALMVDFTRNVDGLQLSSFLYRPDTRGKLHLNPVWDYDRSLDSYDGRDDSVSGTWGRNFLWFPRLFADPEFAQSSADRWQKLRRTTLSTAALHSLVDSLAAEITEPVAAANFAKWNATSNRPRTGGWPAELAAMKTWIASRTAWMDSQLVSTPSFTPSATQIILTNPGAGTVYYTVDGSDPRLPDIPGAASLLIAEAAPARGLIPAAANGGDVLAAAWKGGQEPFNDTGWISGVTGLGFNYPGLIGLDVGAMRGITGSAFLRVPFTVNSPASLTTLTLGMKWEDGFVAWLNGVEVAAMNKPDPLTWNAVSTASHSVGTDFDTFDISSHLSALRAGGNILAIQAMNVSASNSDLLAMPTLEARSGSTGGLSPAAVAYTGPVTLGAAAKITARVRNGMAWSGPVDSTFYINTGPASAANLAVSEIMYRPADASPAELLAGISDRDKFEFLELCNISPAQTIRLTGVRFEEREIAGRMEGIHFSFDDAAITFLKPGERLVIVENPEAFALRYGSGRPVAGAYQGALSNDGATLTLLDSASAVLRSFAYNDQLPWPTAADGDGYSLVLTNPPANPDHGDPANWTPSAAVHGTPGTGAGLAFSGDPAADADDDGLTAIVEYALGSSDAQPGASAREPQAAFSTGGAGGFRYTLDLNTTGLTTAAEFSEDLTTWSAGPANSAGVRLVDRRHNGNGTETFEWLPDPARASVFMRLKVVR